MGRKYSVKKYAFLQKYNKNPQICGFLLVPRGRFELPALGL